MIDQETYQALSPEAREQAKEVLKQRFKYTNRDHPFAAQLIRFGFEELLGKIASGLEAEQTLTSLQHGDATKPPELKGKYKPEDFLKKKFSLVSLPQLVVQLQEAINSPKTSADDIAKIISNDVKLTASLLRLVNSPLYGMVTPVTTVSRAVAIVGMRQLSSLAIGATLISNISQRLQGANLEKFWLHSIACASICKRFAEQTNRDEAERYFIDGLLHDIGRLFILSAYPEEADAIYSYGAFKGLSMHAAELKFLGFSHVDVGGLILKKWNLSESTTDAVIFHHTPSLRKDTPHDDHHLVHLADAMAKALGYHASGDIYVPVIDPTAWDKLGLKIDDLSATIADLDLEISTVAQIMLSTGK